MRGCRVTVTVLGIGRLYTHEERSPAKTERSQSDSLVHKPDLYTTEHYCVPVHEYAASEKQMLVSHGTGREANGLSLAHTPSLETSFCPLTKHNLALMWIQELCDTMEHTQSAIGGSWGAITAFRREARPLGAALAFPATAGNPWTRFPAHSCNIQTPTTDLSTASTVLKGSSKGIV